MTGDALIKCKPTHYAAKGYDTFEIIGTNVKLHRKRLGLTSTKLARQAGVSLSMISKIESCKIKASVGVLVAVAQALNVQVDDLLRHEPDGIRFCFYCGSRVSTKL